MTDDQRHEHERLAAKLQNPRDHDEYRTAMQASVLWLMQEVGEMRSALDARTLTVEQLAAFVKSMDDEKFKAEAWRRASSLFKRIGGGLAMLAAIAAAWHAVEFLLAKMGWRR